LARPYPDVTSVAPRGLRPWLARRGAAHVVELDGGQDERLATPGGQRRVTAARAPARPRGRRDADWGRACGPVAPGAGARPAACGGGYSGYSPGFGEIGARVGPFAAAPLPIGAYAPRWFMRPVHMDPEEAVRAYLDLGGRGAFVAMHWGTFRLSDEPPL